MAGNIEPVFLDTSVWIGIARLQESYNIYGNIKREMSSS